MKQVLALLAAVLLIGGAYIVRTQLLAPQAAGTEQPTAADGLRVTCATELSAVCAVLEDVVVTEEAAGTTAQRLAEGGPTDIDVWVTSSGWAGIANDARNRGGQAPLFAQDPPVAARSPMVVAVKRQDADTLTAECGGTLDWGCLDRLLVARELDVAIPDPAATMTGLAGLAHAAAGLLGTDFSTSDFASAEFAAWIAGFADAAEITTNPIELMVTFGPAAPELGITTEAQAIRTVERSSREPPVIVYAQPYATLDLVTVGVNVDRTRAAQLSEQLRDALVEREWRVDAMPPEGFFEGAVPLEADDGLPSPGALEALRLEWERSR